MKFRESSEVTKGSRHQKVEEPPGTPRRGAWSMDLEESASHHDELCLVSASRKIDGRARPFAQRKIIEISSFVLDGVQIYLGHSLW